MNTPPRPKRFSLDQWRETYWSDVYKGSGQFGLALDGAEGTLQFALMVTEFTHLEHSMERVLALLLEVDEMIAAHVMWSILSARARIEVMQSVLERARHTARYPVDFDQILAEFKKINTARNIFVHARWYTDLVTGTIYMIGPNDDPTLLGMAAMKEFDIAEIKALRNRMVDLHLQISRICAVEREKAQLQG
jgi:hypothetical protein